MSVRNGVGASWTHAAAILSESRIGSLICTLVGRCDASAHGARVNRLGARLVQTFAILPPVERHAMVSLLILVAVIGHLAMTWLLPPAARPTPILSAGALLAASLTAIAAGARRGQSTLNSRTLDEGTRNHTSDP